MSASYIPEKVNTVCTYQCNSDPGQLIASREVRKVVYNRGGLNEVLLTKDDKNTMKQFTCKADQHSFWSWMSFGLGIIIGAALLLSGPVGWTIMALGVVVMATTAVVYLRAKHECSEPLEAGHWKLVHPSVKFDGALALTHNSILKCEKGGLLTPILDQQAAMRAAHRIARNNIGEVVIDSLIAVAAGAGIASGVGEISAAMGAASVAGTSTWAAGGLTTLKLGGLMVGGTAVTVGATDAERWAIRNTDDDESYEKVNEADELDWKPEFANDASKLNGDDPANLRDLYTINPKGYITGVKETYNTMKLSNQLQGDLEELQKTMESKSAGGKVNIRDLHKEPMAKKIVSDIRDGKYPDKMVEKALDGEKVVRPKKVLGITNDVEEISKESTHELKQKGVDGYANVMAIMPLVTTWLSENGRKDLADAIQEDSKNGINVIAVTQ